MKRSGKRKEERKGRGEANEGGRKKRRKRRNKDRRKGGWERREGEKEGKKKADIIAIARDVHNGTY